MSSNFERLQKITNQAYAKNFSCLFYVEPRNLPNHGQDDLVLLIFMNRMIGVLKLRIESAVLEKLKNCQNGTFEPVHEI
jgi:hypothetical protein